MDYELFKKNLLDFFANKMQTYLDAVNVAKPDLTLTKPSKFIYGYVNTLKNTENVVFYLYPLTYNFNWFTTEHCELNLILDAFITVKGEAQETLTKKVDRYMEAIDNMIKENRSLGGLVGQTLIEKADPFDSIEGVSNDIQGAIFNLNITLDI